MEPEISHRCKSCGVAMRRGAQHCHQCGAAFATPTESVSLSDDASIAGGGEITPSVEDEKANLVAVKSAEASDISHSKRQRVKTAARDMVADNVMPRVEKLRHVSSVVLEEAAAIDPSMRFVLIAILLFVVFLVLLLLSFVK